MKFKININWKATFLVLADIVIGVYLVMAISSWNKPDIADRICTKVDVNIEDENINGFLKTADVKHLLTMRQMYPLNKPVSTIDTRKIENTLSSMPFVKTAQCYIDQEGHTTISVTQRTPIVRVKAWNGADYYVDDAGGVMPNSQYTSDMIIVTGRLSQRYACEYIGIMASIIMQNDFWHNQIEQINVLADKTIELIPRVGNHIICIGRLPESKDKETREKKVTEFLNSQFHKMEQFYKYGLSTAGWDKYSYINIEYKDQVVCTRRPGFE